MTRVALSEPNVTSLALLQAVHRLEERMVTNGTMKALLVSFFLKKSVVSVRLEVTQYVLALVAK